MVRFSKNKPGCKCCACASSDSCCHDGVPAEMKLIVPAGFTDGTCDACDLVVGTFILSQVGPATSFCDPGAVSTCWTKINADWCDLGAGDVDLELSGLLLCDVFSSPRECQMRVRILIGIRFANYGLDITRTEKCDGFVWDLPLLSEDLTSGGVGAVCSAVASSVTIEKN